MTCTKVTGAAERRAVGANRLTVCTSYCVNAPTVSGVRSANLPKPAAQDSAALGQHAHRHPDARRIVHRLDDVVAIGAEAQLERQRDR